MSKMSFRTPKGEFRWAFINGQGRKNLNDQLEYSIDVAMPWEDAESTVKALEKFWEENKPKGSKAPKSMGYKLDDGVCTFTLKTKTTYPSGDAKKIRVYNAQAKEIDLPADKKVGNGSIGRASGIAAIYDAGTAARGVTLFLDAVQLVKFVEYKSGDSFDVDPEGEDFGEEQPFTADTLE
jgi:hypothetical protein